MKTAVIIPALNEESTIRNVLRKAKNMNPSEDIFVIDDGSNDRTAEVARTENVRVHKHVINRGLGGAIGTGLALVKLYHYDIAITLDADGQHEPEDCKKVIQPILEGKADVVIGSRLLEGQGMPAIRKMYNLAGNIFTWVIFGIWTTDSQSGFRAFSKKAIDLMEIKSNRMEVSSEIFKEIKRHGLRLQEVPIKAIYTEYSQSKGQNFFMGVKTLVRLVILRIRNK